MLELIRIAWGVRLLADDLAVKVPPESQPMVSPKRSSATPAPTAPLDASAAPEQIVKAADVAARDGLQIASQEGIPPSVREAVDQVRKGLGALKEAMSPEKLIEPDGREHMIKLAGELRERINELRASVTRSCDPDFGKSLKERVDSVSSAKPVARLTANAFANRAFANPSAIKEALMDPKGNRVDPKRAAILKTLIDAMDPASRNKAQDALRRAGLSLEVADVWGSSNKASTAARVSMDVTLKREQATAAPIAKETSKMGATIKGRVTVKAETIRSGLEDLLKEKIKDKTQGLIDVGQVQLLKGPPLQFRVPLANAPTGLNLAEITITATGDGKFVVTVDPKGAGSIANALGKLASTVHGDLEPKQGLTYLFDLLKDVGLNFGTVRTEDGAYVSMMESNLASANKGNPLLTMLDVPTSIPLTGDAQVKLEDVQIRQTRYSFDQNGNLSIDLEAEANGSLTQGKGASTEHLPTPDAIKLHAEARIPYGRSSDPAEVEVRDGRVTVKVDRKDADAARRYLLDKGYGDIHAAAEEVELDISGHADILEDGSAKVDFDSKAVAKKIGVNADDNTIQSSGRKVDVRARGSATIDKSGDVSADADVGVSGQKVKYGDRNADVKAEDIEAQAAARIKVTQHPDVIKAKGELENLQQDRKKWGSDQARLAEELHAKETEIATEREKKPPDGTRLYLLLGEREALKNRFKAVDEQITKLDKSIAAQKINLAELQKQHPSAIELNDLKGRLLVKEGRFFYRKDGKEREITLDKAQIEQLGIKKLEIGKNISLEDIKGNLLVQDGSYFYQDQQGNLIDVPLGKAELNKLGIKKLVVGETITVEELRGNLVARDGRFFYKDKDGNRIQVPLSEIQVQDLGLQKLQYKQHPSVVKAQGELAKLHQERSKLVRTQGPGAGIADLDMKIAAQRAELEKLQTEHPAEIDLEQLKARLVIRDSQFFYKDKDGNLIHVPLSDAQIKELSLSQAHLGKEGLTVRDLKGGVTYKDGTLQIGDNRVSLTNAQFKDLGLAEFKRNPDGSLDVTGLKVTVDVQKGTLRIGDKEIDISGTQLKDLGMQEAHVRADGSMDLKGLTGDVVLQKGTLRIGGQEVLTLTGAQIDALALASLETYKDGKILDLKKLTGDLTLKNGVLRIGNKEVTLTGEQLKALDKLGLNIAVGTDRSVSVSGDADITAQVKVAVQTLDTDIEDLCRQIPAGPSGEADKKALREAVKRGDAAALDGALRKVQEHTPSLAGTIDEIRNKKDKVIEAARVGVYLRNTTVTHDANGVRVTGKVSIEAQDVSTRWQGRPQSRREVTEKAARTVVKTSADVKKLNEFFEGRWKVLKEKLGGPISSLYRRVRSEDIGLLVSAVASENPERLVKALMEARKNNPQLAPEIDQILNQQIEAGYFSFDSHHSLGEIRDQLNRGTVWQDAAQLTEYFANNWNKVTDPDREGLQPDIEKLIQGFAHGDVKQTEEDSKNLRAALKSTDPACLIDAILKVKEHYPALSGQIEGILTKPIGDHSLRELQECLNKGMVTEQTRVTSGETRIGQVRLQDVGFEFAYNKDGSISFKIPAGAQLSLGQIELLAANLPPDIPADKRQQLEAVLRRVVDFQARADAWTLSVTNLDIGIDKDGNTSCSVDVVSTTTKGFSLPDATDLMGRSGGSWTVGDVTMTGSLSLKMNAQSEITECDFTKGDIALDYSKHTPELKGYLMNTLNTRLRQAHAGLEIEDVKFHENGEIELVVRNRNQADTITHVRIGSDSRMIKIDDNTSFENPLWNLTVVAPLFVNRIARGLAADKLQGVRKTEDGSLVVDPQAIAGPKGANIKTPSLTKGRISFGIDYYMPTETAAPQ